MNNDINQPQGSPPVGGMGLPPLPPVPPMPVGSGQAEPTTPPPPPTPTPEPVVSSHLSTLPEVPTPSSEPLTEMSTGLPTLEPIAPPSPLSETAKPEKPVKPKRRISKKLAIGGALVLLLLGGVIAFASQFGLLRIGLQPRAGSPCSPNGAEDCGADGVKTRCENYQWQVIGTCGGSQPTAAPTAPPTAAPPSGGGSCSAGVLGLGDCCAAGKITEHMRNADCSLYDRCEKSWSACGGATTAPTATPGTGGGGGTPAPTATPGTGGGGANCSGSLSHPACKACGNPGPCVYLNTQGYCSTTTGNNCAWDFAQICTPGECVNAGGGKWKKCASNGSTWEGEYNNSSCTAAGPTATQAPTATPVPTVTGYTGGCSTVSGDAVCRGDSVGTTCGTGFVGGVEAVTRICQATGTTSSNGVTFPVCTCEAVLAPTVTVTMTPPPTPIGTCRCDFGSKEGEIGPYTCKDASGNVTVPRQLFRVGCIGATSVGTGGTTGPGSQTQASCGNSGQACCVPENFPGQSVNICNSGLYCNNGVCSTNAAVCGGAQGTGSTATAKCKVFKCGNQCNDGNQCTVGVREADCATASLDGQCGQIDYISDNGGYCGVMVQNCYGSCAGTTTGGGTPPAGGGELPGGGTPPAGTATPVGTAPACVNTRIFINGSTTVATAEQMSAIKIGDTIRMVVQGNNASLAGARFIVKIGGNDVSSGGFEVTAAFSPIQASGVREFYYDYPITQGGAYTIEGYVNSVPPTVTATPVPTVTATPTATTGECNVSSTLNLNNGSCVGRSFADAINFGVTSNISSGSGTVTLVSAPAGLASGDEILIINLQGSSGVGDYETASITGISENALTLDKNLTKSYDGTKNKIMVQRVPHYTTVTINGTMTADAFSCSRFLGGVLFFRASGAVNVGSSGKIDMSGKGFNGGGNVDQNGGIQGASRVGCGTNVAAANGGGGGGGRSNAWNVDPSNGAGGGGGAYGTAGGAGANSSGGNKGGVAGAVYGVADLTTKLFPGSGGGGGGNEMNGPSGNGGNGGGIITIFADSIAVTGQVNSSGTNATAAYNTAGGGGGGAGGSILLNARNLTLGANLTKATGGTGSAGPKGGQGGKGGVGRISIRYSTGSTGTTTPASQSAVLVSNVVAPSVAGASSDRVLSFLEKLIKLIKPQ